MTNKFDVTILKEGEYKTFEMSFEEYEQFLTEIDESGFENYIEHGDRGNVYVTVCIKDIEKLLLKKIREQLKAIYPDYDGTTLTI